ncbi:MAG: ABC transporter permease subunit [Magnetococcales bacterium]|nr:ABC transporter permease subunit [Magnetococcales bacterium]NGZ05290.1 ABC transporter permease subunit [Magnetococcales bacterium]
MNRYLFLWLVCVLVYWFSGEWKTTAESFWWRSQEWEDGIWMALLAMWIALPVACVVGVWIIEYRYDQMRLVWLELIGLASAIPGVVWGWVIWSLWQPSTPDVVDSALILVGIALPTMTALVVQLLKAVPDSLYLEAEAMGASRWQTLRLIVFPGLKRALLAVAVLGVGRGMGECLAILVTSGQKIQLPSGVTDAMQLLSVTLESEQSHAPASGLAHDPLLGVMVILLLLIALLINTAAGYVMQSVRRGWNDD